MADMKIIIGADIKNLQSELAKAGGVTQNFANQTTAANAKVGTSFATMSSAAKTAGTAISGLGSTLLSGGLALGISAAIAGLIALGRALLDISAAQRRFNEVIDGAKSAYVKATLEVDKMRSAFDKAKSGIISKEEALKLYNSTIGKTIGQTNSLDIAEKNFIANAENYIKYTLYKAAAQVALGKAAEAAFKAEAAMMQTQKRGILEGYISQEGLKARRQREALKEQAEFQKIYNDLILKANAFGFKGIEQQEKEVKVIQKKIDKQKEYVRTLPAPWKGAFLGPEAPKMTIKPDVTIVPNVKEVVITPEAQKAVLDGMKKMFDKAQLEQFQEDATVLIQEAITEIQINAIISAAEAVGEALAGNKNALPDLFGNLIKGIGNQIANLGKALISAGIKMLAAKKAIQALNLTPQTAIIAGVALVILGSALKASLNKQAQGFASGTTGVSQGGFYDVGERGRERVFLPQGSKVQPANEVQAFGGGGVTLMPSIHYDGTGFRLMLNRVDAQMSRNG